MPHSASDTPHWGTTSHHSLRGTPFDTYLQLLDERKLP
jgi:hypothetical protein